MGGEVGTESAAVAAATAAAAHVVVVVIIRRTVAIATKDDLGIVICCLLVVNYVDAVCRDVSSCTLIYSGWRPVGCMQEAGVSNIVGRAHSEAMKCEERAGGCLGVIV